MTHQDIVAYNNSLITRSSNCDILEYVRHINSMYKEPIDLSFMEDLLSYVENDTCCIPHTLLVKYGIFKEKNASQHIKETLELYNMISETNICKHDLEYRLCEICQNDIDSLLTNVREQSATSRGVKYCNIYYLKPDAFKLILMRSKCEKKYAKYYILLEKAIKYYHDYQLAYKEYIISQRDENIIRLENKIDEQTTKINELLGYAKDAKEDLNSLLDITIEHIEQTEVSVIDRVNTPPGECDIEQLIVFEVESSLYIIRGAMSYVSSKCRQLCGKSLAKIIKDNLSNVSNDQYKYLRYYKDVPNARYLFKVAKDRLKSDIEISGNKITIVNESISTDYVLNKIQEIFDQRLTVDITDTQKKEVKPKVDKKVKNIRSKSKTLKW